MNEWESFRERLEHLSAVNQLKALEYLEFLLWQQGNSREPGLQVAKERMERLERGEGQPITKSEFWERLSNKLN